MQGPDRPGHGGKASGSRGDRAPEQNQDLIAALEWLPVASLILAGDSTMLAANRAWADLSGAPSAAAGGDGWLSIVEPADSGPLRARLRSAAAAGGAGSADCRLTGASRIRWSRWWWRSGPAGQLVVCVAECSGQPAHGAAGRGDRAPAASLANGAAPSAAASYRPEPDVGLTGSGPDAGGAGSLTDMLGLVVHRLFGVGLELQSAASRADGPAAERLRRAIDELDNLIREVRSAAFRHGRPRHDR